MEKKTISDVMICPVCGSSSCYEYNRDEVEFGIDGTGHYNVDCHCTNCGKDFRLYTEFEYSIKYSKACIR